MINGSGSGAGARGDEQRTRRDEASARRAAAQAASGAQSSAQPSAVTGARERPRRPMMLPGVASSVSRWDRRRDVVSIGECLVEMSHRPDGAYQASIAGDAFNTLFYAARLGMRSGLISSIGDDLFTPMIVERITRERIDISHVLRLTGRRNGLYFIENDSWGERHFHYWRENSAATETLLHANPARLASYILDTHVLLVTGVTLAVLKEPTRLRDLLESLDHRTTIVLDANYRPRLWGNARDFQFAIESILPFVDIYLPSRQDLKSAWRGSEPIDLLRTAQAIGVRTIVMKDGANGCSILRDDELVALPAIEGVHVVDTTGAGDAFDAGVIAGLIRGAALEDACQLGQRVAARSLMVSGAIDPGFTPHAIDATWRNE